MNSNPVLYSSQSDLRGVQLFRAISRKLARQRRGDDYEEDSTDSERSSSGSSNNSVSDTMRTESLRKMFQSLSLNSRASSESTKNNPPKRILRQPKTYRYQKGPSGLPTIRVIVPTGRDADCCAHVR